MKWWEDSLVTFDLETTSADVEEARIVSAFVGLVNVKDEIIGKETIVNPGVEIPLDAVAIHGITTQMAYEKGLPHSEGVAFVVNELKQYEGHFAFVAFNGAYDFTVLDREAQRVGVTPLKPAPVIDPFVLDKHFDKYRKGSRKLTEMATFYGVPFDNAHNAEADALATARLARAIGKKHSPDEDASKLHAQQIKWRAQQSASLQTYFRKSNPDAVVDGRWPLIPRKED